MKSKAKISLTVSFLFLIAFIFMFQSPISIWKPLGETSTDSSVFKTVALYIDNGYMPYKDIFDHKGPLIYLYNWLGIQISYWRGIWIIELFSLFTTILFIYKLARLFCGYFFSILTTVTVLSSLYFYFDGGNFTEEYALPYITISLYVFIDFFKNSHISKKRLIVCGFSFGAIFLLRANMASLWIVFCLAILIITIKDSSRKILSYYILWFLIGVFIISIPIILWLIFNGAFSSFIYDYFIFNSLYSKDPSRSSFHAKLTSLIYFLNEPSILISVFTSIYLVNAKRNRLSIIYFLYIILNLLLTCISGQTYKHYGMVFVPMLVYPFAYIFSTLENKCLEKNNISFIIVCLFLVTLTAPNWLNGLQDMVTAYGKYQKGESTTWSGTTAEVCAYIEGNTNKEDRILVWDNWNIAYARTKRLCASKYTYISPIAYIDKNIFPEYYHELSINIPKLIIFPKGSSPNEEMQKFINCYGYIKKAKIDNVIIYAVK